MLANEQEVEEIKNKLGGQKQHRYTGAGLSGIYGIVYCRHCWQHPGTGFQKNHFNISG